MGSPEDVGALSAAVARLLGLPAAEVEGLTRLSGGASRETWSFRAGGRELILRRDPPGRPGPAGGMAHEAAAMRACTRAGLPVPEVLADDDGTVLGSAGLVMTRVEGEALARRILRDDAYASARPRLADQLGTFLAGLHAVDPGEVPGLDTTDPLAQYWAAYESIDDVSPTFEAARRWLETHRPDPPERAVIVHGDLRLGNVLVGPDGLTAVLDWELLHLGDPVEDLAWVCVRAWRFGSPLPVAGVGTVEQLLGAYEAAGGSAVDRDAFRWWLVQKTQQWGIGCMGQAAAHLLGMARSVELAAVGRRVAEQEWDLVELLAPDAAEEAAVAPPPRAAAKADGHRAYGRPTAPELVEAVREFLSGTVMDATEGRVRFHARVAANVLGIVERELALGPAHAEANARGLAALGVASTAELGAAIRAGRFDGGEADDRYRRDAELWAFLAATARDRLTVANPKHLAAP